MSSRPTLRRMKSGVTPADVISSAVSWLWVVLAGWMARLLASPTLARWLKSWRWSMKDRPASTPPFEAKDGACAFGQEFLGPIVIRMARQAGVGHPSDGGVVVQELSHSLRVADVTVHTQAERFDAGQRVPAVERRLASADIAQDLYARLDDERRQPHA